MSSNFLQFGPRILLCYSCACKENNVFRKRKALPGLLLLETTTSGNRELQAGGREHGEAWCRNADTSFYFSVFSRAVARVDLTTYGLVGSMTGHMTGLQEKRGERERKQEKEEEECLRV